MDDATTGERRITVAIIDDHLLFGESLARLVGDEPDIDVVGVVTDGAGALELIDANPPTVAVVDVEMPDIQGIALTAEITRRHPDTKVVIVTGRTDTEILVAAVEAGCSGFITKDRAANEIVDAIRSVAAGDVPLTPSQLSRLLPVISGTGTGDRNPLTERELEVLGLMATGMSNKEIAAELHLSVNTIRNYVQYVLNKLDAHSKLEAVAIAVERGIITRR